MFLGCSKELKFQGNLSKNKETKIPTGALLICFLDLISSFCLPISCLSSWFCCSYKQCCGRWVNDNVFVWSLTTESSGFRWGQQAWTVQPGLLLSSETTQKILHNFSGLWQLKERKRYLNYCQVSLWNLKFQPRQRLYPLAAGSDQETQGSEQNFSFWWYLVNPVVPRKWFKPGLCSFTASPTLLIFLLYDAFWCSCCIYPWKWGFGQRDNLKENVFPVDHWVDDV